MEKVRLMFCHLSLGNAPATWPSIAELKAGQKDANDGVDVDKLFRN